MTRRHITPGQLSLFAVPASPVTAVVQPSPVAAVVTLPEPARAPAPQPAPSDRFCLETLPLPSGVRRAESYRNWYCVRHPDGSPRDALAMLYVSFSSGGNPVGYQYCPALGRGWLSRSSWLDDVWQPLMRAMRAFAAQTLALADEDVARLGYLTCAWQQETRPLLRDEPHQGNVEPNRNVRKLLAV